MSILKLLDILIQGFCFREFLNLCFANLFSLDTWDKSLFFCWTVKCKYLDISFLTSWACFIWNNWRKKRRLWNKTGSVLFYLFRFILLGWQIGPLVYLVEVHWIINFRTFSTFLWVKLYDWSILCLVLIFTTFA